MRLLFLDQLTLEVKLDNLSTLYYVALSAPPSSRAASSGEYFLVFTFNHSLSLVNPTYTACAGFTVSESHAHIRGMLIKVCVSDRDAVRSDRDVI